MTYKLHLNEDKRFWQALSPPGRWYLVGNLGCTQTSHSQSQVFFLPAVKLQCAGLFCLLQVQVCLALGQTVSLTQ